MSPSDDLAARRARHQPCDTGDPISHLVPDAPTVICGACSHAVGPYSHDEPWPCDAFVAFTTLALMEINLAEVRACLGEEVAEERQARQAAESKRDRLAAALAAEQANHRGAHVQMLEDTLEQERAARRTAEARAERLAAALTEILTVDQPYVLWERLQHIEGLARAALAGDANG